MNKKILVIASLFLMVALLFKDHITTNKKDALRKKHQQFLEKLSVNTPTNLSKKERIALGLPPNAYYEQAFALTMDPNTGRPMPERLQNIRQELIAGRLLRGVGGDSNNPWIDRGPNNQGGRTRGIMFDPTDVGNPNPNADYNRVFAGGVSGGLWVHPDITNPNLSWNLVPGIGANISVTVIIHDPNDPQTFYIGSGESYTNGQALGRGIWKSSDAGATWTQVFGGYDDNNNGGQLIDGVFYVNDMVARDVAGVTELYATIAGAFYAPTSGSDVQQFNGLNEQGLYKSVDGGANWVRIPFNEPNNTPKNPNDLEIDLNNNIWFTTTRSSFGFNGGEIWKSVDGINFVMMDEIPNAHRTELEPSSIDPNTFYVVANVGNQANIYKTTDEFTTRTTLPEPNDADLGIPASDYTRGQAFYDLPIEVDANDNIFVGGIDLFRSTNGGTTWEQISKWSNNPNLNTLSVPFVHADQHAIVFRPGTGNQNQALLGTDGGVYFSPNLLQNTSSLSITSRNKDYNTIQFYYGTIDPTGAANGDDLFGGTQDNGTQFLVNGSAGSNSFFDPVGGDGAYTEIDDSGQYMIQTYTGNSHRHINYPTISSAYNVASRSGGDFINQAELDKNLDILYSNSSTSSTNRIERNANILNGSGAIVRTQLTNSLLTQRPSAFKISPYTTTSSKLMVGLRNGRLIRIDNADTSPSFNLLHDFVGSISDIEFGLTEDEIFVTIHNYGVPSVWFSNDGGANWTDIEGNLPDMPVKCILQNPLLPQELIIGTELGVWSTRDYTATNVSWGPSYNGMSDVTVLDLDLRESDNLILAATHGRGFFTSQFTSVPLGIETIETPQPFTVAPTIASTSISVYAKENLANTLLVVYNLSGQKVGVHNWDGSQTTIPISSLSKGLYILVLEKENTPIASTKFIKQ